jgi:hypothetical protein
MDRRQAVLAWTHHPDDLRVRAMSLSHSNLTMRKRPASAVLCIHVIQCLEITPQCSSPGSASSPIAKGTYLLAARHSAKAQLQPASDIPGTGGAREKLRSGVNETTHEQMSVSAGPTGPGGVSVTRAADEHSARLPE